MWERDRRVSIILLPGASGKEALTHILDACGETTAAPTLAPTGYPSFAPSESCKTTTEVDAHVTDLITACVKVISGTSKTCPTECYTMWRKVILQQSVEC